MTKPIVKIKNWSFQNGRLHGDVIDHPRFPEDETVTTSVVLRRPLNAKHGDTVETKNTIYVLVGEKK